jgi:hypothetical protein
MHAQMPHAYQTLNQPDSVRRPVCCCCLCRGYRGSSSGTRRHGSSATDVTEEQLHKTRLLELLEARSARHTGRLDAGHLVK